MFIEAINILLNLQTVRGISKLANRFPNQRAKSFYPRLKAQDIWSAVPACLLSKYTSEPIR